MKKIITEDNLCYYKINGVVYSRQATPLEIYSRDELRLVIE